jgi:hypothetical protein
LLELALILCLQEEEPNVASPFVSSLFIWPEKCLLLVRGVHCCFQTLSVEEREKVDSHPGISCSIHVKLDFSGVEVNNLARWLIEFPVASRNGVRALLRKDGQQLLERLCWLSELKL